MMLFLFSILTWKFTTIGRSELITYIENDFKWRINHLAINKNFKDKFTFLSKSKWSLMTKLFGLHADSDNVFFKIDSISRGVVLPIALSISLIFFNSLKLHHTRNNYFFFFLFFLSNFYVERILKFALKTPQKWCQLTLLISLEITTDFNLDGNMVKWNSLYKFK